jgi:hypothetical protein
VLIMPAFHSASISTKMLQELGGATVIGPILVGLDKPVQITSLGAIKVVQAGVAGKPSPDFGGDGIIPVLMPAFIELGSLAEVFEIRHGAWLKIVGGHGPAGTMPMRPTENAMSEWRDCQGSSSFGQRSPVFSTRSGRRRRRNS